VVQAPPGKRASASLNSQSVSAVGALLKHFQAGHAVSYRTLISTGVRTMRTLRSVG
jgi:hypothetical protein